MKTLDKLLTLLLCIVAAIMAGCDLLIETFRYRKPDNMDIDEYYYFGNN